MLGMTLSSVPVYLWSAWITASMLLLVLPVLAGSLVMLVADLHYNTVFFDAGFGGDPVFYQHLFCREHKHMTSRVPSIYLADNRCANHTYVWWARAYSLEWALHLFPSTTYKCKLCLAWVSSILELSAHGLPTYGDIF